MRIDTQLMQTGLSPQLREKLLLEKSMHIDAAIDQQHAMSDFITLFVKKVAPMQVLPTEILQDTLWPHEHTLQRGGLLECDLNSTPIPIVLI